MLLHKIASCVPFKKKVMKLSVERKKVQKTQKNAKKNKPIDHEAPSNISDFQFNTKNVTVKKRYEELQI